MTAFHLLGNRVERQIQFVEHMKISDYRYVSMVGIVKIGVVTFIFFYIRVYK